jgi:CRP-like cAMP-binding protein
VLDLNLRGDLSYPLALALEQRKIPFIFTTGYGSSAIPARFADVRRLEKPFETDRVAEVLLDHFLEARQATRAPAAAPDMAAPPNPLIAKLSRGCPLSEDDQRLLAQATARPRRVYARQVLVREGERNSFVRLVLDGFAYRFVTLPSGVGRIVAVLMPGDLCDLHAPILGTMDHSIATLTDCLIVDLPPETIEALTREPRIQRALWWSNLVDESILRAWLINISGRQALERLAHFLLEWHIRLKTIGRSLDGRCAFPLTQEELAQTLGMSNVHVNRTLQQLRKKGLVTVHRGVLTVLDEDKLTRLASFDPTYLHLGRVGAAA